MEESLGIAQAAFCRLDVLPITKIKVQWPHLQRFLEFS